MIDYEINHKTFLRAYELLRVDSKKTKLFFKDKRIPQSEKKILHSLIDLRKNNFDQGVERLLSIRSINPFVNGFKYFLLGAFYNNNSFFIESIKAYNASIHNFEQANNTNYLFRPVSALFTTLANMKDLEGVKNCYNKLLTLPIDTEFKKVIKSKCEIHYALLKENGMKANKLVDDILLNSTNIIEDRLSHFFVFKIMSLFKIQDIDECFSILKLYERTKGYRVNGNYIYLKTMLNHLYKGHPIYAYKKDFKHGGQLYYELLVIKELSNRNINQANIYWKELSLINPFVYRDRFEFFGDECLFKESLKRYEKLIAKSSPLIDEEVLNTLKSNSSKLLYILNESNGLLNKEDLIQYIWKEPWSPESDARLRSLIYQLKRKKEVLIECKDAHYYLVA